MRRRTRLTASHALGRSILVMILAAALSAAVLTGCGSEDSADPTPTPDTFDAETLRTVVLQEGESDVPYVTGNFTNQGSTVAYTATYGDDADKLTVVVSRTTDDIEREDRFLDLRESVNLLVGGEANYDLPGSERAFSYKALLRQRPSHAVFVLSDAFILFVTATSNDPASADHILDDARMRGFIEPMFARIQDLARNEQAGTPAS